MYQLIVLAVLFGLFYAMYGFKPNIKSLIAQKFKKFLILLGVLLLIGLMLTGKLSWLFSLILAAFIALQRLSFLLARFFPSLQRFFPDLRQTEPGERPSRERPSRKSSSKMDKEEAYQVLGLTPDASHEKIIEAHRRLMQKLHPDRGGSDYFAAKLNQARDVLLKR